MSIDRRWRTLGLLLLLGGCVPSSSEGPSSPQAPPQYRPVNPAGLEGVLGRDARALIARFGQPDLDIREGNARKLQFGSEVCVLDAYLYPQERGDPVVSYLDARLPDGRDIDRASCVAALSLR